MLKNLISSLFSKIFIALTLLATLLIQTRQLGSEVVGQVSLLILNIAIIQTISEIYTGSAIVYFIPKYNLRKIYSNGLLWTLTCIVLINTFFYLLEIGIKDLWLHVFVLSFVSSLNAFHAVILLAKEKITTYNFLLFFQPFILFVCLSTCILMLEINTVYAFIYSAYTSYSISFLISSYHITKLINAENQIKAAIDTLSILKNGLVNQLGNLAHTLSNRYNYYLIAGNALVGIYASATSLIESVWILSGSISPIVLTYIANQKNEQHNSKITLVLSKISFLLSMFCVFILLIIPDTYFNLIIGKDFEGTKSIMLLLAPGVLAISFSSIISHYFSGMGKQKILLLANSSGLAVTLCTSYYFILNYGLKGACYAASTAYTVQALVLIIIFIKLNQFSWLDLFRLKSDIPLLSDTNDKRNRNKI